MPNLFQSTALQAIYDGTVANSPGGVAALADFRTGGTDGLDSSIESLDKRIASFEFARISALTNAKSSSEYPYDRAGLRREFLDEVLSLLLQRSMDTGAPVVKNYASGGALVAVTAPLITAGDIQIPDPLFKGGNQTALVKSATSGWGNLDNLDTSTAAASDPRRLLLTIEGRGIFEAYANLIDAVFAEGDNLANVDQGAQVVSAIQPITADGITYDRVAQVSGTGPDVDGDGKPDPTFNTFLLETTAPTSRVIKDANGNVDLESSTTTTGARRLLLSPEEASFQSATNDFRALVDAITFSVTTIPVGSTKPTGISVQASMAPSTTFTPLVVESVNALVLNVPGKGTTFPDTRIVANYRVTAPNGSSYLVGLSTEGKIYVTSLANISSRVSTVGTIPSLSGLEYLLFYNEARIKVLRAQLAYKEAIVREIQEDLKQANEALSDLELQSGAITATDAEGNETGQYSAETLRMSLFTATNSAAGKPIFLPTGNDVYHYPEEWASNRTTLKNYIDRRSAEAQEATLDYQNVLNRFNNALEVMAKLQEKLDTLLKSQLRNFA